MRNGFWNVDLGTLDFATGQRVLYAVKAVGKKSGKVSWAGKMVDGSAGPAVRIEDAQRFPSHKQAQDVAAEIERALVGCATVTVEEVK